MTSIQKLLLASSNPHKVDEIRKMLPDKYLLLGLSDLQWTKDIPEPYDTFEDNARAKVNYIFQHTGLPCFADDSGLEVDALDGRPGVWSARYAGEQKNSDDNVEKVLRELGDMSHRSARFVAIIAYCKNENDCFLFTGKVEGTISLNPAGNGGFGYDPIFIPAGFDQTFGQLDPSIKNMISHRAKAMKKFVDFL